MNRREFLKSIPVVVISIGGLIAGEKWGPGPVQRCATEGIIPLEQYAEMMGVDLARSFSDGLITYDYMTATWFAASDDGRVYKSFDGGSTWSIIEVETITDGARCQP